MSNFDLTLQRKKEIENGLLELMLDRPYAAISVKDLAEHMHFVRKTYYHYFPNKSACLESLIDRMIYECNLDAIQNLPENASQQAICENQLKFWMSHKDFLDAIIRNGLNAYFVERYLHYVWCEDKAMLENMKTDKVACDEDVLFFYLSGEIFLLLKWCNEGFVLSLEEMVAKRMRLTHEPLVSLK